VQKGRKSITFTNQQKCKKGEILSPLHWYLHIELLWSHNREGVYRDGRLESDCHLIFPDIAHFFVTEAGNALAAIGNIHEGDSHILK
jgi:hypothetical protein